MKKEIGRVVDLEALAAQVSDFGAQCATRQRCIRCGIHPEERIEHVERCRKRLVAA